MTSTSKGNGLRMVRFVASLVVVLGFAPAGSASALPPIAPAPGAYTTDGPVQAIAHAGGRTYIGGAFTRVGRRTGAGVILSPAGAAEAFPEVAGGDVYAAITDRNGGWYIGGSFTTVGGQPHVGVAHVRKDRSIDPGFNVSVTDSGGLAAPVYALELSPPRPDGDRTLYVGGEFTRIGNSVPLQGRRNLAALRASDGNVEGGFATGTSCPGLDPACQGAVRALALANVPVTGGAPQPVLFVGGDFTKVDTPQTVGIDRPGVAALWGVGATDPTDVPMDGEVIAWAPSLGGSGTDRLLRSVHAIQAGPPSDAACGTNTCSYMAVYFGGWKLESDSENAAALAFQFSLKKDTRAPNPLDSFGTWNANPGGCSGCAVESMLLLGGKLYFGGNFTKVGPDPQVSVSHLAMINAIDPPPNTAFAANAKRIAPGVNQPVGPTGPVRALAASASSTKTLLAGGDFGDRVVALNTDTGAPASGWTAPAPDAPVHALATDAAGKSTTSIYAGGKLRSLGAVARRGLAAFDSSGALLPWAPDLSGGAAAAPKVHALAASDSTVYAGGQGPGGAVLAAIDAASGALSSPFPNVTSSTGTPDVLSLSLLGSTLYVGGAFEAIGGQARANLAALDAGTGAVNGWNPGVTFANGKDKPAVRAILPACGAVYVGGWFDTAGGQPRQSLAALDPAGTGNATPWDPSPDGAVLALARYGPTIYAGGTFSHVAGGLRQRLAGLNVSDGRLTPFDAAVDSQTLGSSVRALAVSDSALYFGGHFANVGGKDRSHLTAVDPGTGQALEWNPGVGRTDVDTRVDALALGSDTLYAGGTFGNVGSTAQRGVAGFGGGAGSPFAGGACVSSASTGSGGPPSGPAPSGGGGPVPTPRSTNSGGSSAALVGPGSVAVQGPRLNVTFRLSRAASVRLRFARWVRGRYVPFTDVTVRGRKGLNRVSFSRRRVGGRTLVRGRYRLGLAPLPAAAGARQQALYFVVRVGSV
jgi:hypothetical protein